MGALTDAVGQARKALVAVAGVVVQAVALGVLHGTALHYAQLFVALATAAGVYGVPNKPKTAPAPPAAKDAGLTVVELCIIAILALVIVLVFFGTVGH